VCRRGCGLVNCWIKLNLKYANSISADYKIDATILGTFSSALVFCIGFDISDGPGKLDVHMRGWMVSRYAMGMSLRVGQNA